MVCLPEFWEDSRGGSVNRPTLRSMYIEWFTLSELSEKKCASEENFRLICVPLSYLLLVPDQEGSVNCLLGVWSAPAS